MPLDHPEYNALLAMSASVGADPLRVQGAGGNTSIKHDGLLWIKASGKWLMEAQNEDIMVPVSIQPLADAMSRNDPSADTTQVFVPTALNPAGLRPSIETTVHTALPQRVVVHVHCVDTIAIALQATMNELLDAHLQGFNWASVPYVKPGLTLSRSITQALQPDTDVIVLGNHGLVVAADTVDQANELLEKTCAALRQPVREASSADIAALESLAAGSDYQLPESIEAHAVACDPIATRIAAGGSLYPDHVIFLGEGSVLARDDESPTLVSKRCESAGRPMPMCILFPGKGVLMHRSANAGQQALARCLSDVIARVPEAASVNYLSAAQNDELLDWDAEKYRQALNKA